MIALAAWIVLTPAMFPGTVLAAAGGLAFGALGGSLIACAGAVGGGLAAFALARTVARQQADAPRAEQARGCPAFTRSWNGAVSPPSSRRA